MKYEIITAGEAMLRLSVPTGHRLEEATSFAVQVAGAEANVAVALAQLGHGVSWISRLPSNPLGRSVAKSLAGKGVDLSMVEWEENGRLGTYFVELNAPPRPVSVVYDRKESTASCLSRDDFPAGVVESSRVVYLSGITPALSDSCLDASLSLAKRARDSQALWCIDVNYRAKLWPPDAARLCLEQLAEDADLVICTREDAAHVFGIEGTPSEVLSRLRDITGAERTVVTLGAEGAAWDDGDHRGIVPAVPATIMDRLGAGDAFAAGVIDGVLEGDLELGVRRGVLLAALALGTHGDQLTTSRAEMEGLLASGQRGVDR